MMFNAGSFAVATESWSDRTIVSEAMAVLRTIYGPAIPAPTGHILTRWGADPFACGSYSCVAPGASEADYDALAAPVGDRLFFAGEATCRDYPALVTGAYVSGLREGKRVAALLGKGDASDPTSPDAGGKGRHRHRRG